MGIKKFFSFIGRVINNYTKRGGFLIARGMSFSFLISIVPMVFLAISLSSLFYQIYPGIEKAIYMKVLSILPAEISNEIIKNIKAITSSWQGYTIFTVIYLLITGYGFFGATASGIGSVTQNFHRSKTFLKVNFFIILSFIIFFLLLIISTFIDFLVLKIFNIISWIPNKSQWANIIIKFATLILITLALIFFYWAFLEKKRFKHVIFISTGIGVIWAIFSRLSSYFVGMFSGRKAIYGAFFSSVIFLMWVEIFINILLLGGLIITELYHGVKKSE